MNHIRTPNRFELVLDDPVIIGMRQAALQMGAKAFEKVKDADANEEPRPKKTVAVCGCWVCGFFLLGGIDGLLAKGEHEV